VGWQRRATAAAELAELRLGAVQGARFSSIARLLDRHTRRRPAHRDRFGRALPLSVSARTLAGIGDERWAEPRGSTARCGRRLLSCWAVAPKELASVRRRRRATAASCDDGGGAKARSSLGRRLSLIARLLGHHVRQQAVHRDRLNRAQPLIMFARTLPPIGNARHGHGTRVASMSTSIDEWRRGVRR